MNSSSHNREGKIGKRDKYNSRYGEQKRITHNTRSITSSQPLVLYTRTRKTSNRRSIPSIRLPFVRLLIIPLFRYLLSLTTTQPHTDYLSTPSYRPYSRHSSRVVSPLNSLLFFGYYVSRPLLIRSVYLVTHVSGPPSLEPHPSGCTRPPRPTCSYSLSTLYSSQRLLQMGHSHTRDFSVMEIWNFFGTSLH